MQNSLKWRFLLFYLLFATKAFSQYYVLGIDPIHGLQGRFNPSIERTFGDNFSASFNYVKGIYSVGTSGNINSQSVVYELRGKSFMPGIRFYPFTKKNIAPKGLSIGAYYRFYSFEEEYTGEDYSARSPFSPTSRLPVDVNTKAKATNYGFSIAYKFTAGIIIVEPLIGIGAINSEWDEPNERNKIDPFFRNNLDEFLFSGRVELKLGFYVPQIENKPKMLKDLPSESMGNFENENSPLEITDTNSVLLYVYRPKRLSGFAIGYDLWINDSLSTRIFNGSYHIFRLKKGGTYTISAKTEEQKTMQVTFEEGQSYYLECTVGVGLFVGRPKLKFVAPYEGKGNFLFLKKKGESKRKP